MSCGRCRQVREPRTMPASSPSLSDRTPAAQPRQPRCYGSKPPSCCTALASSMLRALVNASSLYYAENSHLPTHALADAATYHAAGSRT